GGIRFDKLNEEEGYTPWRAYGQSKLANILFTKELNRRLQDKKVFVNAVHPGVVKTELGRNLGGVTFYLGKLLSMVGKSPEQGAMNTLYCATSPVIETENLSGLHFEPVGRSTAPTPAANDPQLAEK